MPRFRRDNFTIFVALIKQIEIKNRQLKQKKKRISFSHFDRIFFVFITQLSEKVWDKIKIVKPDTILKWTRKYIAKLSTYPHKNAPVGRPCIPKEIRELVLKMKNDNIFMGYGKILGELLKLGIELSRTI